MTEAILLVDDEILILESLQRELGMNFSHIDIAQSGADGLRKLAGKTPYAVVMSDFRMPHMNGIEFLEQVRKISPNSVRMMLTGNAELQVAIQAVNEGQIFRFLTKPCSHDLLVSSLETGLKQYQLVMAEKVLLEKTLVGSINMMIEMLAIVNSKAYGKAIRIRKLVSFINQHLQSENAWQYELAASLSQLGWIIFPPAMIDKLKTLKPLTSHEQLLYSMHPFAAKKLISKIPRLEVISQIIEGQGRSIDDLYLENDHSEKYLVDYGSHLISTCVEYDTLLEQGMAADTALDQMASSRNRYRPEILVAIKKMEQEQELTHQGVIETVSTEDLEVGMVLAQDIIDNKGIIQIKKLTTVTRPMLIQIYSLMAKPGMSIEKVNIYQQ